MKIFKILYILTFFVSVEAFGQKDKSLSSNSDEVKFSSDKIEVDEKNKIVTASGNVVIINDSRKINADKVTYNQNN